MKNMHGRGIATSLSELVNDEGPAIGRDKAERWRNVLEEMGEVANRHQFEAIETILSPVRAAMDKFVSADGEKIRREHHESPDRKNGRYA